MSIETLLNKPNVTRVKFTPEYSVVCSVGKRPFAGVIEIEFAPDVYLLEFISFEEWLHGLWGSEMTIEDLARVTFDKLTEVLGDIPLRVAVHARTTVHAPACAIIERS